MKIPVHEIEGDYYCAIDDIALVVSRVAGVPRTRERCLADMIEDYDIFLYCPSPPKYYKSHDEIYCPSLAGIYKATKWVYLCSGLKSADPSNPKPSINILEISKPNGTKVFASFDGFEKEEYHEAWYIEPAPKDCYLSLIDAQICLSQGNSDISFIIQNTPQPDQLEAQPVAEASEADMVLADEALDTRQINSYLKFIYALCADKGIDINERGIAGKLTIEAETKGIKLSANTIRKIINEVNEVAE